MGSLTADSDIVQCQFLTAHVKRVQDSCARRFKLRSAKWRTYIYSPSKSSQLKNF